MKANLLPTNVAFVNLFKMLMTLLSVSVSQDPVFLMDPDTQTSVSRGLMQMMAETSFKPFRNFLLSMHSFGLIVANCSGWISSFSRRFFLGLKRIGDKKCMTSLTYTLICLNYHCYFDKLYVLSIFCITSIGEIL